MSSRVERPRGAIGVAGWAANVRTDERIDRRLESRVGLESGFHFVAPSRTWERSTRGVLKCSLQFERERYHEKETEIG